MLRKLILENMNTHKTSGRNTVHKGTKTEKRLKIGNDSGAQSTWNSFKAPCKKSCKTEE